MSESRVSESNLQALEKTCLSVDRLQSYRRPILKKYGRIVDMTGSGSRGRREFLGMFGLMSRQRP